MSRFHFLLLIALFFHVLSFSWVFADEDKDTLKLFALHVVGGEEEVRLVLDVNEAVKVKSFLLSAPYRLIVDLEKTELALQNNRQSSDPGFIKKINYGKTNEGTLRLVIESKVPMVVKQFFKAANENKNQERLVFDLQKVDETTFRIALLKQAEEKRLLEAAVAAEKKKVESEVALKGDIAKKERKKRIVIDPGHGGKDSGAIAQTGVFEKDIVLSFSKELAQNLTQTGHFEVLLTRADDRFLPLSKRVEIARNFGADLFLSIHADSLPEDRRVRGTAIYTLSEKASDAMAERLAREHNRSDAIAGHEIINAPDEVVDILFDLTRRETSNLSIAFARHFYDDLNESMRFFKNPLQSAAFIVLRVPDIPSALIELGFLSNKDDLKLLLSDSWRQKAAIDMAETITKYFEKPFSSYNQ